MCLLLVNSCHDASNLKNEKLFMKIRYQIREEPFFYLLFSWFFSYLTSELLFSARNLFIIILFLSWR